jgi:LemA protein
MKKGLLVLLGVILLLVILVGYVVGQYNNMVVQEEDVFNKQAQVEVVLQRRFDLIPNLVESVKGMMQQEQEVFGNIADARERYAQATSGSQEKVEAANEVEGALGRLLVVMEAYPELKSDQTVINLMDELAGSENRVAVERKRYNDAVTSFNKLIRVFPNRFFANMFGFEEKILFEAAEGADVVPQVDLDISF